MKLVLINCEFDFMHDQGHPFEYIGLDFDDDSSSKFELKKDEKLEIISYSAYALLSEELKAVKADNDRVVKMHEQICSVAMLRFDKITKLENQLIILKDNRRVDEDIKSTYVERIAELEKANVTLTSDWDYQVKMRVELYQENKTLKLKLAKALEAFVSISKTNGSSALYMQQEAERMIKALSQITESEVRK